MEIFLIAALAYAAGRHSSTEDNKALPGVVPIVFTYAAFRALDVIYTEGKRQWSKA